MKNYSDFEIELLEDSKQNIIYRLYFAEKQLELRPNVEKICETFKDKSRYIELPCNVGDTVYIVDEYSNEFDEIDKCEITSFGYNGVFIYFKIDKDDFCYSAGHIGKTVFLTREEAEQKLKELKND